MTHREERIARKLDRLRHALRDLTLDNRDERYADHYARIWDTETLDVVIGWIEQARALPAGQIEWTWRHNAYTSTANATPDRAEAEHSAATVRHHNPGDDVGIMTRHVTEWTEAGERSGPAGPDTAETREAREVHPDDRPRDGESKCGEPGCVLFDGHPLHHRAEDGRAWLDPGEPLNLGVRSERRPVERVRDVVPSDLDSDSGPFASSEPGPWRGQVDRSGPQFPNT